MAKNLILLSAVLKELGYAPTNGQLIGISRKLNTKFGYRCERLHSQEAQGFRAFVDTNVIGRKQMLEVIRSMKVVNCIPPPIEAEVHTEKLLGKEVGEFLKEEADQTPTVEVATLRPPPERVQAADVHSVLDIFLRTFDAYCRPDNTALVDILNGIRVDMATISFQAGMTTGLVERAVKHMEQASAQDVLVYPTPPLPSIEHLPDYLERCAASVPGKLVQYMEVAEKLRTLLKTEEVPVWDYDLPTDAVWKGERWVHLVYTDRFLGDWDALRNAEHQKAIRHMLALLTQNPYHKSLNTHKRRYGGSNPPGVHPDGVYSRASDNVRVYWLQTGEDTIEFHRIIVKSG